MYNYSFSALDRGPHYCSVTTEDPTDQISVDIADTDQHKKRKKKSLKRKDCIKRETLIWKNEWSKHLSLFKKTSIWSFLHVSESPDLLFTLSFCGYLCFRAWRILWGNLYVHLTQTGWYSLQGWNRRPLNCMTFEPLTRYSSLCEGFVFFARTHRCVLWPSKSCCHCH